VPYPFRPTLAKRVGDLTLAALMTSPLIEPAQCVKRHVLAGILLAIVCFTNVGCEFLAESTFKLADESRLPKWVTLPRGLTRADVSLTMSYYVMPWGRSARFILQDKNKQAIEKENGKARCRNPFQLENPSQGFPSSYPSYEAVIVNGITEIIEHRKMEPIFYVTDDPVVWKQYQSMGCS
jgi:hypothetical protein